MEYVRFGRTKLEVSTVGIGTGGASRLGLAQGSTDEEAMAIVRRGLELGINYFDTAESYRNEYILGRALEGHRDEVVLSTKVTPVLDDGELCDPAGLRLAVERSLANLRTDVIDIFHLHRVLIESYEHTVNVLVPTVMELRDEGKIRFIGISENTGGDVNHVMLQNAIKDNYWDVIMLNFNLFNQSARNGILPTAIKNDIAIEIMASARSQFSRPDLLIAELDRLISTGELRPDQINPLNPLDFLHSSDLDLDLTLTEASYRFAAHEPGVHVVLVGTGNIAHLEENVDALNRGILPADVRERLRSAFGHLQAEVHIAGRSTRPNSSSM